MQACKPHTGSDGEPVKTLLALFTDPRKQQDAGEFIDVTIQVLHSAGAVPAEAKAAVRERAWQPAASVKCTDAERLREFEAWDAREPASCVSEGCYATLCKEIKCHVCTLESRVFEQHVVFRLPLPEVPVGGGAAAKDDGFVSVGKRGKARGGQQPRAAALPQLQPVGIKESLASLLFRMEEDTEIARCECCGERRGGSLRTFVRCPESLVFSVNRSHHEWQKDEYGNVVYSVRKIQTPLRIQDVLDLSDFADLRALEMTRSGGAKYRLSGVIYHRGDAVSGHYWAVTRGLTDNQWRCFSDEQVSDVEPPFGVSTTAKVLFYTRM